MTPQERAAFVSELNDLERDVSLADKSSSVFINGDLPSFSLLSLTGPTLSHREILQDFNHIELNKKTQLELQMKLKRKIFRDAHQTKKYPAIKGSTRSQSIMAEENHRPPFLGKKFTMGKVWHSYREKMEKAKNNVCYFDSEAGKEFLQQVQTR